MSNAFDKNVQALRAAFGSEVLASRLSMIRIAVVTPELALPAGGQLLAAVLADTLARLWPNIDFMGHAAEQQLAIARSAAISGGMSGVGLRIGCEPSYHCAVTIGGDVPPSLSGTKVIRIGADGWKAVLGPAACCTDSPNPAGPAFAAALASAQVFHHLFAPELSDVGANVPDEVTFDVRELCDAPALEVSPLELSDITVFGVGAVSHSFLWLVQHWPMEVVGSLTLVDPDAYGASNGQRYAFMGVHGKDVYKVDAMQKRLQDAHPRLSVHAVRMDTNSYCAQHGYDKPLERVVAGLDSAEARRQLALKLPKHAINMWTEGLRVGASRYVARRECACLACSYVENTTSPLDEVARIYEDTKLRPDLIRDLLDSGRGMTTEEALALASHWRIPADTLAGQPLRSALPVGCAMGQLTSLQTSEAVDVPFAFSSLFAGVAGFLMLLKDLVVTTDSEGWVQHVFKRPTKAMHQIIAPHPECACCAEMVYAELEQVIEETSL